MRSRTMNKNTQILFVIHFIYGAVLSVSKECIPRDYGFGGTVCVCNSNHCDTIDPLSPLPQGQYEIYSSTKAGLRFRKTVGSFTHSQKKDSGYVIKIDSSKQYQTIFGFGGAFTDSFGINVKLLNGKLQEQLLRSYFSEEGIEYSLCRVPMGGTDFSTRPYTYDDVEGDVTLEKFNLTYEDYNYKISLMHEALSLRKGQLKFIASPWTAPAWMKTNNALSGLGVLYEKYYQLWADYFIKFLEHYEKENINFWGITTGNEPANALLPNLPINSLGWTPFSQAKWIAENLGPTIRNSKYKDIKIMVLDDQRFLLPWVPQLLFINKETKKIVDGIAVHWYWNHLFPVALVQLTHDKFPDKFILGTEAGFGDNLYKGTVELGSWHRAEKFTNYIIEDINHWVTGWLDWSMVLDDQGGPTYIDNTADAPIIVNATAQEFYKNPMFYAMGHFSKFVPADSKRIHFHVNTIKVKVSAFQRPDKGVAVVIFNGNSHDVNVTVYDERRGSIRRTITKRSINTMVYW